MLDPEAITYGPSGLISRSADLFDMQDEIVARLAKTLDTQLVALPLGDPGRNGSFLSSV